MPEFVLNRDYSLRSLTGHMLDFKKGVPTYVPPACVKEAVALGAEPVAGEKPDVLPPEEPAAVVPTGDERQAKLFEAFAVLEERNEREDFNAQGLPNTKALEKLLGFGVDAKERNTAWMAYREAKAP